MHVSVLLSLSPCRLTLVPQSHVRQQTTAGNWAKKEQLVLQDVKGAVVVYKVMSTFSLKGSVEERNWN